MGFKRVNWLGFWVLALVLASGCSQKTVESQAASESLRIGFVAPLTGNAEWYGEHQWKAIQLGVDEINQGGGINGRKLEVVAEDDQCLPKLGAEVMQKLAAVDRVPLVLGAYCSSVCMAMAPIAEANKVVMVNECNTDKLREAGEYVFRIKPGAAQEGKFIADAMRARGATRLALLFINNEYGVSTKDEVKKNFAADGGKVVAEEAFEQGASDFRSQLAKVREARPDAVYFVGYAKENGLLVRQAHELGLRQALYSSLTLESADFLEAAGEAAEGIVYPYLYDPNSPEAVVRAYNEKFKARYGEDSEMWGALYYDALVLLKPVLEKCGNDSGCLKDGLLKVQGFEGVTGRMEFDEKGDVVKPYLLKTVRGGGFATLAD